MTRFTRILPIFFISLTLSSCALNRAKSHKMLEVRSGYEEKESKLNEGGSAISPIQTPAKRVKVYVYPHQLPNGDYFLGGYIFAEVEKEKVLLRGGMN